MLTCVVFLVSFFSAFASPAWLQHGGTALDMHEALPTQALRFSEQRSKTGSPAGAISVVAYGNALNPGNGARRFKCWDMNIVTNQNGMLPQVNHGGPASCYTEHATHNMVASKVELSTAWCRGQNAGGAGGPYGAATSHEDFWTVINHRAMKQFFQFDRFGIRFKLEPYGPDVNHRRPSPTACRTGDVPTNWLLAGAILTPTTRKHDIANTYVATFEDVGAGGANPLPFHTGKILRHGVMGYASSNEWNEVPVAPPGGAAHMPGALGAGAWPAPGTVPLPIYVQDQAEAVINHFGFRNTVSMNLMTGRSLPLVPNEQRFIGFQDDVLQGASANIPAFKAATLNYAANFIGRRLNHATTNYPKWKIMTVMVLDELQNQMSTAMLSQPCNSMQARLPNPPDECTHNYNGALGVAFNALSWDLAAGSIVNVGAEIARLQAALVVPAINDHERRAITCVLKQAKMLFSQPLGGAGAAGANGRAPGHDYAEQRGNAKRAIKVLLKSVYAGGSGPENRAADFMRMGAFSAFLGTDSMVNCKSGLDRTGLVAPMFQAFAMMVYSMEKNHVVAANTLPRACKDTLLYIAENWEDIQGYSNSILTRNYKKEVFAYLTTGNQRNGMPPGLCMATAGRSSEQVMQSGGAKLISQFRSTILELVIKTSLPITYLSTGAVGLKWGGRPSKLGPIAEQFLPTEIMQGGNRVALMCPDTYTDNCDRRGS